uniref:RTP1_C1 domain-containing protein n=1 Tax=Syphacia muris TaxID=451379 RepID=A0A0N5AJ63_9BILA
MFAKYTFVDQLAGVLSVRPLFLQNQEKQRPLYYGNILKQFLYVMQFHPMAENVATWFSATIHKIYKHVPRAVDVCIFDSILHPWELLTSSLLPADSNQLFWSQQLDMSLKTIALYLKGLPPMTGMLCFNRFLKIFPLWLQIYGHLQLAYQNSTDRTAVKKSSFVTELETMLLQTLNDPGFSNINEKAEFISGQVQAKWFKAFKTVLVEFKEKAKISEVLTENCDNDDDHYVNKYDDITLKYSPDVDEVRWLDDVVTGITSLLQAMDKNESQRLLTLIFTNCLCKWRKYNADGIESQEYSRFLNETFDSTSADDDNNNMRMQYLMEHLGELVITLDFNSIDVLLESVYLKVKELITKQSFDIILNNEDEAEKSINELQLKTAELAIALISGTLLVASQNEQFSSLLTGTASVLKTLCDAIETLHATKKKSFTQILQSGEQLLDVLEAAGIIIEKRDYSNTNRPDVGGSHLKACSRTGLLDEVYRDLKDPVEAVRGHALILLARLVRRRDSCIKYIENDSEIMRKVIEQIVSSDSYVYMAAINAMAELAYWKQHYFDMIVEFFLKPVSTLRKIAEENPEFDFTEKEKKDFLIVQRVKVGEALAKVCRALGDMAAWHFERLIDPILYMVKHTCDRQLKASSLCALGDLVLACKGRGFYNVLNEMLLMVEQFLTGGSEPLLRRASLTLLRSIITSFDTEILTGMSSQLARVHRHLRQLLLADQDEGIRLLAELCLIDIKEQLNKSFTDMTEAGIRRIKIT